MLTGISTLAIGDVNSLSQEYIEPPRFSWSDLYQDLPQNLLLTSDVFPPPPVESWYWSIMNMVLFLVLAWYLDSVLPDEFGVREKPLFFLKMDYWGFKKKMKRGEETINRDLRTWLNNVSSRYNQKANPNQHKRNTFTALFNKSTPKSSTSLLTSLTSSTAVSTKPSLLTTLFH